MMTSADWLLLGALYVLAHFAFYALWLRNVESFRSERGIFGYHVVSVLVVVAVLGTASARSASSEMIAVSASILSLHGIYSVSFLEVWSLTQGSYSLQILDSVARGSEDGRSVPNFLVEIGEQKKVIRTDGLLRLGLLRRQGDTIALTVAGRALTAVLAVVAKIVSLDR